MVGRRKVAMLSTVEERSSRRGRACGGLSRRLSTWTMVCSAQKGERVSAKIDQMCEGEGVRNHQAASQQLLPRPYIDHHHKFDCLNCLYYCCYYCIIPLHYFPAGDSARWCTLGNVPCAACLLARATIDTTTTTTTQQQKNLMPL